MATNPYGANQFQLDPRQKMCWDLYVNPNSETFGNGLQSAIKAGYEPDYANQITTTEWFKEKVRRFNMLGKAEKVLDEMLDLDATEPADRKIKQDTAKFIAERQGKNHGYALRNEVTGADGAELSIQIVKYGDNTREVQTETVSSTTTESI